MFSNRMEALLSDESLMEDNKKFEASVRTLTLREYDFLDFRYLHMFKAENLL